MTCIVGYLDNKQNKVFIGGDSAASNDHTIIIRNDPKVFRVGDFIIGGTTSFRMLQLLMYSLKPKRVNNKDVHQYMCTDFIDEVRRCLRGGGFLEESNGIESGGKFLVGYKNMLFEVDSDFHIAEPSNGVACIGSGSDYAFGAMYATCERSPENKITKALEAAAYYSPSVRGPFIIKSTN